MSATLSEVLSRRLNPESKRTLLENIFRRSFVAADVYYFDDYLAYYERELVSLNFRKWVRSGSGPDSGVQSHAELLRVVQLLQGSLQLPKSMICDQLQALYTTAEADSLKRTLDLALRIWLMINTREECLRLQTPQTPVIDWKDGCTIKQVLRQAFPHSRGGLSMRDSRLNPSFTAAFMANVCDLQLHWTDSLADHLRLDRQQKILHVFNHKSFLQCHLRKIIETVSTYEM